MDNSKGRRILFATVALILVPVIGIVFLNLIDSKLDPRITEIHKRSYTVSPAAEKGMQLLKKLHSELATQTGPVPAEMTGGFLPETAYSAVKAGIPKLLIEYKTPLQTYDEILKLGEIGQDPKEIADVIFTGPSPAMSILRIWKVRALEVNRLLYSGNEKEALKQMQSTVSLHRESLKYPSVLILKMVNIAVIRMIRVFAEDAAKTMPRFAALLTPQVREGFRLELEAPQVIEDTMIWELGWMQLLDTNNPRAKKISGGLGESKQTLVTQIDNFLMLSPFYFTRNRLENTLYSCWTDGGAVPNNYRFLYPVVWQYTKIFCSSVSGRMVKIQKELEELKRPFETGSVK